MYTKWGVSFLGTSLNIYGDRKAMKHTHVLALSAALAAASTSALADSHKLELHGDIGGIFFDEPIDDDFIWGVGIGYVLNDNWTLDVVRSRFDSETESGVDVDGTQYRLDALYHINTESLWRPYVAFGIGDQKREYNIGGVKVDSRDTLVNLGAGVKRSLGGNWEFRSDIRAFNSLDNEYTDITVNAGIAYLLGKTSAPVRAAAPVVEPERDSDGDGVLDSKDQCPDTPRTHKVDEVGCSLKLTEVVSIELNITFDFDKAIIKPEYEGEVANLAKFMDQYADTEVTVEGHTDSRGADDYNQKLSQQRADAVKAALISKYNIGADRVNAIGHGEARPTADNSTEEGRKKNRRVVGNVSTKVTTTETRN
jgi:OOP family OmpA-OmpF porin